MNIQEYFHISQEEIKEKKYNIIIPICLGNKFFSEKTVINDNVRRYLEWALEHTKDKVLFVIVDKIQLTNYLIRHKNRSEKSGLKHVLTEGQKIKSNIEKLVSKSHDKKIEIIIWDEYEKQDNFCHNTTQLVYKEFESNKEFRTAVLSAVKTSVTDRPFSNEEYLKLCNYVLDEFSIVYSGTMYEKDYYGLYIYPETDSVVYLIENIKAGRLFSTLEEKLPNVKVALAILK